MKKPVVLIGIIMLVCSMFSAIAETSDSIHWQAYSASVFAKAKSNHRVVLLFAKSDSCHWCQLMRSKTFSNPSLIKLINTNYTPVMLDADKNQDITTQYRIIDIPTIIVFNLDGKPANTFKGYMGAAQMIKNLRGISK